MPSDEDKKRFHRLQISMSDLADAVGYLDVIIAKAWHHPPWYGRGVTYKYQAAFTTAAIVSYCRPFTRSNGLPAFPADLVKYSGEERKLHEKILKLRNQVYAHSDAAMSTFTALEAGVIEGTPQLRLSAEEATCLRNMADRTQRAACAAEEEIRMRLIGRSATEQVAG